MKIILVLWLIALAGCGNSAARNGLGLPAKNANAIVTQGDDSKPSDILLQVSFHGGMVPSGNTGHREFVVTRDGKYSTSGDVDRKRKGQLQSAELNELIRLINEADFVALRSKQFTGMCPTAFDGEELTYSFHTRTGVETIASCKVEIDAKAPLFIKVAEILTKYIR